MNPVSAEDGEIYRYLVIDSGPVIRLTGLTSLWRKAKQFYTVPAVLQEIRDAKARQHLESLPFELRTREPSRQAIQAVSDFARQTGDFQSLSTVDLQVLALLYDLEREGCGNVDHVRTTPKRIVGVGRIQQLGGDCNQSTSVASIDPPDNIENDDDDQSDDSDSEAEGVVDHRGDAEEDLNKESTGEDDNVGTLKPKTWAMLVNPIEASKTLPLISESAEAGAQVNQQFISAFTSKQNLNDVDADDSGQFSDAESEAGDEVGNRDDQSSGDPATANDHNMTPSQRQALEEDLKSEFPSLAAACLVISEVDDDEVLSLLDHEARRKAEEERRLKSLQPLSKSGKLYDSLGKYGQMLEQNTSKIFKSSNKETPKEEAETKAKKEERGNNESRIIGGMTLAGQGVDVDDDGEGWITSTKDIRALKSAGAVDPQKNPRNLDNTTVVQGNPGPCLSQRAACATTDFAMQNVILQMNLELLSVDGVKVRKLKSWVTRCGACFKIYTSSENVGVLGTKRLFCARCGSDFMQRIAASVDGKTGRLRLHLSKHYRHNLRGTKFSLPKPGTGNKYQGDLLLREDQLLMGAWNQKLKMHSGGKAKSAAQSIFGKDIATNVGCHATAASSDCIKVGFGRRNPNAVKGRERRGKKKKSADKACGLRRY